jgi:acetyl-CoA C-acetyltransferase
MNNVVIISALRTPIGSFLGKLSSVSSIKLGESVVKGILQHSKVNPNSIDEILVGQVLQANSGQAPAKQIALNSGLPYTVPATSINKVCASGLKATTLGIQSIKVGDNDCVIAVGVENMSVAPFYLNHRNGKKFGNDNINDSIVKDGLTDSFSKELMGCFGDLCAETNKITREQQDNFTVQSYQKAKYAWDNHLFKNEIVPVKYSVKDKEFIVDRDEEFEKVDFDKISKLSPIFSKNGTVTAANASTLNDGASSILLMNETYAKANNYKPLAKVISYADVSNEPKYFTTAPSKAIEKVLEKAKLNINTIDLFEINEAFANVAIANINLLNLDPEKVNIKGGAVALGHPLGCSGTRILTTLTHSLIEKKKKYGIAAICNGGGGATAILIESCI